MEQAEEKVTYEKFCEEKIMSLLADTKRLLVEQSELSDMVDAYYSSMKRDTVATSADFEHERDRGHTWDLGEDQQELEDSLSDIDTSVRKYFEIYKPFIKEAFEKDLDISDIELLFRDFDGCFPYSEREYREILDSVRDGVLITSSNYGAIDTYDKRVYSGAMMQYLSHEFLYDKEKETVLLLCDIHSMSGFVIGENIKDAYTFVRDFDKQKITVLINESRLDSCINNSLFYNDNVPCYSEKSLCILRKFVGLPCVEYSNFLYNIEIAEKNGFDFYGRDCETLLGMLYEQGRKYHVKEQEMINISHKIEFDSNMEPTKHMLNYIPGTLQVVDVVKPQGDDHGYQVVEAMYHDLKDVAYMDHRDNTIYYLNTKGISRPMNINKGGR